MTRYPQVLVNVRGVDKARAAGSPELAAAVAAAQAELGNTGRVLVRPSGTEPTVRVMVEAKDPRHAKRLADSLATTVRTVSLPGAPRPCARFIPFHDPVAFLPTQGRKDYRITVFHRGAPILDLCPQGGRRGRRDQPGKPTMLRMRHDDPAGAHGLLRHQQGVITRSQALDAGLTDKAITVRLRSGRWQRLQTGVYATFSGEPPRNAQLWAAVLRAGPGAALSHQTAAELYGLLAVPTPVIHVTIPGDRRIARQPGLVVHHSARLAWTRHPALTPPRTRIEDSVLDLIETGGSMDDAVGLILRASGSRRTTPERILAALQRRPKMPRRAAVLQALGEAKDGAQSLLEFRYVNRVERPHGLPPGHRQNPVRRGGRSQYQDLSYDGYDLVVELDGRAAHPEWFRWADIRRDNANAATGQVTLRYGVG